MSQEHCNRVEIVVSCNEGTETHPDKIKFIKTSTEDPIIEIDFTNLQHIPDSSGEETQRKKFKVKNAGGGHPHHG